MDLINIFPYFLIVDIVVQQKSWIIMDSKIISSKDIHALTVSMKNQDGVYGCIPPPKLRLTQPSFGGCEISFDSTFAKNSGSMLVYWRV